MAFLSPQPRVPEYFSFAGVRVVGRTPKSILCEFSDGSTRYVPISQISPDCALLDQEIHDGELLVRVWLAKKIIDGEDQTTIDQGPTVHELMEELKKLTHRVNTLERIIYDEKPSEPKDDSCDFRIMKG